MENEAATTRPPAAMGIALGGSLPMFIQQTFIFCVPNQLC